MNNLVLLRHQHKELCALCRSLMSVLDSGSLELHMQELTGALHKLESALRVHLTVEERALYPVLLRHHDEEVRVLAREQREALDELAQAADRFRRTWSSGAAIRAQRGVFAADLRALCGALRERVELEEEQLIPLAGLLAT